MDLYVVTPSGETVASRVHAAALICVKTGAILGAVLALGPLKEEDYMRLIKVSMERKDHLVGITGCEHCWRCFGKPAIILVLYPSLRVEIPEIKIERVGGFPPRLIRPVGVESLDLETDSDLSPLTTAKGDGLAKLTPQLSIGSRLRAR